MLVQQLIPSASAHQHPTTAYATHATYTCTHERTLMYAMHVLVRTDAAQAMTAPTLSFVRVMAMAPQLFPIEKVERGGCLTSFDWLPSSSDVC